MLPHFLARPTLRMVLVLLGFLVWTNTANAQNVVLRFDELPNSTTVTDQYLNQYGVRFSSGNAFFPVHTHQNCGPTCFPTSAPNFISTLPDTSGVVTVDFQYPVSGLTFYMIGVDAFFNQFALIDVYRSGVFYATYPVFGNGNFTVGYTFGSLDNISKIVIRGITDPSGIGFDDFSFTVPWEIKITSSRVAGFLNQTTQNALLSADVSLLANPLPAGFAGGTYSWTFSAPFSALSATNSSSVNFRSGNLGTGTATIVYTKNGVSRSATVTINSILPTLTSFTAQQGSDLISNQNCNEPNPFWWYRQGCIPPQNVGIQFTANVQTPTLISDPAKSGIKYLQAVSAFRKRNEIGQRCTTIRSSEANVDSGWQIDTSDPYDPGGFPPRFFSEGNNLSMTTVDYPKQNLTFAAPHEFIDTLYVDDQFWMYVYYFAGNNAASPLIQRPIGALRWNWGGLVVFDWNGSTHLFNIRSRNASPGPRTGQATTSAVNTQGFLTLADVSCPGGPSLSSNRIDSSRILVKYYYLDILGRSPDGWGWDGYTSNLAQCVFDLDCLQGRRSNLALAFFWSGEFFQRMSTLDPVMTNPPGSPGFNAAVYNPRFIYWCYQFFLRREPDPGGLENHLNKLNSTGDYAQTVFDFIYSPEYRNRPFV
jgi:hypothetical protein